jgi:hypothetical protein
MRGWPICQWDRQALLAQCGEALLRVSKPTGESQRAGQLPWPPPAARPPAAPPRGSIGATGAPPPLPLPRPAGGRLLMTLAAYYDYLGRQVDEEPLYVFDGAFGESAPRLLAGYQVPRPFEQDYHAVLGGRRPEYRWLVMGPGAPRPAPRPAPCAAVRRCPAPRNSRRPGGVCASLLPAQRPSQPASQPASLPTEPAHRPATPRQAARAPRGTWTPV